MREFEEIQSHLSQKIENLEQFLQIEERQEIAIADYKGQSFIIITIQDDTKACTIMVNGIETVIDNFDSTKIFKISNISKIGFIPIDGKKGLLGCGDSHCDFVFFDSNDFCFVELKVNVISEKKYNERRIDALGQLENTIENFNIKLNGDYRGLNKEAYICIPKLYPRTEASWNKAKVKFLEKYGKYGIELFERNHKICK